MANYSYELKLQAVLAYLDGKESMRAIAKRFNISKTPLLNWIALYKENGVQGLIPN
ncbi:helix-turn-helix domain-containing protein [Lysinibacillus capsici]|uniref:helix-turn-helix domain-containing protein n=1 Tax=Lysinibacillus capsici TaxID=2115968 RepID=UPI001B637FDE